MYSKLWNRNFTMVIIGQIISLFGNTILRFAINVYILDLTGSAAIFGTVMAISMVPTILLSPVGGMLADRVNRRDIMVALDFTTSGLCAVFALLLGRVDAVPLISVVLVLLSVIQSFYNPSVQSSVPLLQMGDNVMRGNAVANQVAMLANLIGPALGGMLYGLWGIVPIVYMSTLCFFASAVLEIFIRIPYEKMPAGQSMWRTMKSDFSESMRFMVKDQPAILKGLLSVSLFNLFLSSMVTIGISYIILTVLNLGSQLLGVAETIFGLGGLAGGILAGVLAGKIRTRRLSAVLAISAVCLLPVAAVFFAGAPPMVCYVTLTVCVGLFSGVASLFSIAALTAIQQRTPSHLLGKVYGYVMTLCMVAQPIGSALYGVLFDALSSQLYIVVLAAVAISFVVALLSGKTYAALDAGPAAEATSPEAA